MPTVNAGAIEAQLLLDIQDYMRNSKAIQKQNKQVEKSMQNVGNVVKLVVGSFIVRAAVRGGIKLLKMASDAEEANNLITVSFGRQKKELDKWAASLSRATGKSSFELQRLAGEVQSLLVPMTGTIEAATDLSKRLAGLAVDTSSFFNVVEADVIRDFRSALTGGTETVEKYGSNIKIAALEQFLLEKGIKKTVQQLTSAERALLIVEKLERDLALAVGDAAKTSEGFANRTRALTNTLDDMSRVIGAEVLPVANGLLGIFIDIGQEALTTKGEVGGLTDASRSMATGFLSISRVVASVVGLARLAVNLVTGIFKIVGEAAGAMGFMLEFVFKRIVIAAKKIGIQVEDAFKFIKGSVLQILAGMAEGIDSTVGPALKKVGIDMEGVGKKLQKSADEAFKSVKGDLSPELEALDRKAVRLGESYKEAFGGDSFSAATDMLAKFEDIAASTGEAINELDAVGVAMTKAWEGGAESSEKGSARANRATKALAASVKKEYEKIRKAATEAAMGIEELLNPTNEFADLTLPQLDAALQEVAADLLLVAEAAKLAQGNTKTLKEQLEELFKIREKLLDQRDKEISKEDKLTDAVKETGRVMKEAFAGAAAVAITGSGKVRDAWQSAMKSSGIAILDLAEKQILASAWVAGSGAGSAVAQIPVVGPLLIPGAIALAFATVKALIANLPAFATGGVLGGGGGRDANMFMGTAGEGILPVGLTEQLRSALSVPTSISAPVPQTAGGPGIPTATTNERVADRESAGRPLIIQTWGLPRRSDIMRWDRDVVQKVERRRKGRSFEDK